MIKYNDYKTQGIIYTFGRMNPMTKGHETSINFLIKEGKRLNLKPVLFLSKSEDSDKNPLKYKDKLKYMREIFKDIEIPDTEAKNPFQVVDYLDRHKPPGLKRLVFVVGDDRINDFKNLKNYVNKVLPGVKFEIISSGKRTKGISGTDMRNYVKENNFKKFKENLPSEVSDKLAKEIFNKVKEGLKMKMNEEQWVQDVKPKWKCPKGLFTKSEDEIASTICKASDSLKQAVSRVNFYYNREGATGEEDKKRDGIIAKLHQMCKSETNEAVFMTYDMIKELLRK